MSDTEVTSAQKVPYKLEVRHVGDHGVHPPTADIETTFRTWYEHFLASSLGNSDEGSEIVSSGPFELLVERRKPTARMFRGVFLIGFSSKNTYALDVRVRPERSDYQWVCHLICPNRETMMAIFAYARPEASVFMLAWAEGVKKVAEIRSGVAGINRRERRAPEQRKKFDIIGRIHSNRNSVRELYYLISLELGNGKIVTSEMVRRSTAKLLNQKVQADDLLTILGGIVGAGTLEPVAAEAPNRGKLFRPTMLFDEAVESYLANLRKQKHDTLVRKIAGLQKDILQAQKKMQSKRAELREAGARARQLRELLLEATAELTNTPDVTEEDLMK